MFEKSLILGNDLQRERPLKRWYFHVCSLFTGRLMSLSLSLTALRREFPFFKQDLLSCAELSGVTRNSQWKHAHDTPPHISRAGEVQICSSC